MNNNTDLVCPYLSGKLVRRPTTSLRTCRPTRSWSPQPLRLNDSLCSGTPCGHLFHTHCILEWFGTPRRFLFFFSADPASHPCPMCRMPVAASDLFPVELPSCQNVTCGQHLQSLVLEHGRSTLEAPTPLEEEWVDQGALANLVTPGEVDGLITEKGIWTVILFLLAFAFWGLYGDILLPLLEVVLVNCLMMAGFICFCYVLNQVIRELLG